MARINVYDRSEFGTGELIGWFDDDRTTDTIAENTRWDGNNHRGVMSGLQLGYEELLRTAQGRWVRHYDGRREFNGPEFYEFLTDTQAREWLLQNQTEDSEAALKRYFGEPEEEAGPAVGGRPKVGPAISVAYPEELLERIDAAAKAAGIRRAEWLRRAAAAELERQGA